MTYYIYGEFEFFKDNLTKIYVKRRYLAMAVTKKCLTNNI